MKGKLYICPTPIGNLEDITLRTLRILGEVDFIAAEDTRRTIKLLNHYEIENSLTSYHEHNKRDKGLELIEKIGHGKDVALVSDAGMPGISDPGEDLIKLAIEEDIEVLVLPGATASITALVLSGLPTDNFIFEGFLPSKKSDKKKEIERIGKNIWTSIIYESPFRVLDTLRNMKEFYPGRKISVSREITKKYEETIRGTVKEVLSIFEEKNIRGEFVLILEGKELEEEEISEIDIEKSLREYISSGMKTSSAVKKVSKEYDVPRNTVYKMSLDI